MRTIAILIYVSVALLGLGLLARWEIKRAEKRRFVSDFAYRMQKIREGIEAASRTIGEALLPAVQRSTAAFAALGEALAKIPPVEFGGNPDRLTVKDRGDYFRNDPDPIAHFDGSWRDRD